MIKATPVWAKELKGERNVLLSFSGTLSFEGGLVTAHVAADALYRLYVNGRFAFHGPQRAGRGFWREDTLDLTPFLKKGDNEIELQVQSYLVKSFEYVMQPPFAQAEILVDDTVILATGDNLPARRVLGKEQVSVRYSYQRPFIEDWTLPVRYSEPLTLEAVDHIVLLPRTAPLPRTDKVLPKALIAHGTVALPVKEECRAAKLDHEDDHDYTFRADEVKVNWREVLRKLSHETLNACDEDGTQAFALSAGEFTSVRLPHEDSGFLHFAADVEEDAEVWFVYDEVLVDGDVLPLKHSDSSCNLIPVKMAKGHYEFTALEPRTMHYIKAICACGKVKFTELSLIEYVNGLSRRATFTSSDEALNRVFNAAVATFEQNAAELFMDCPSRERAGWLCDSFFTGRSEKLLTGTSKVEKGFIENFFRATGFPDIEDGMLPMCYPSDETTHNYIPNWAMFLVIELEEYIRRSLDPDMAALAKKRLYKLEEHFCQYLNADGLLQGLRGWVFVEWSQANHWVQDVNFPSNMMYYAMLKAMARMYDDKALDEKAEKIRQAIIRLSYNGKFFRDHMVKDESGALTTPEDITEVCQYYAFFTGVATKEEFPELLQIISNDFGPGHKVEKTHSNVYAANAFIGNFLRMEVLSANGCRKQILGEIKEYFDYMAQTTGTLWENDNSHASCNHGFASHVACIIFRDCLGIESIDEKKKIITLSDEFTAPENVDATLPLLQGSLNVTVRDGVRSVMVSGGYLLD